MKVVMEPVIAFDDVGLKPTVDTPFDGTPEAITADNAIRKADTIIITADGAASS